MVGASKSVAQPCASDPGNGSIDPTAAGLAKIKRVRRGGGCEESNQQRQCTLRCNLQLKTNTIIAALAGTLQLEEPRCFRQNTGRYQTGRDPPYPPVTAVSLAEIAAIFRMASGKASHSSANTRRCRDSAVSFSNTSQVLCNKIGP